MPPKGAILASTSTAVQLTIPSISAKITKPSPRITGLIPLAFCASIKVFRLEDITRYYTEEQLGAAYENAGACITELVERTPGIVAFVPEQFIVHSDEVRLVKDNTISVKDVFAGAEWFPTATPSPLFGFLPLITGTLWVSLFAILFALPFGLAVAVYMSEVANLKVRNCLKPIMEL